MRAKKLGVVLVFVCASAFAQADKRPHVDLALTYDGLRSNTVQSGTFWSQGGALELDAQVFRSLSVVAEGVGLHSPGAGKYNVPFDTVAISFGPRLTFAVPHLSQAIEGFGQGLAGEVHGLHGVYPTPFGADSSALALSTEVGGGVNIRLRRHFALRAFQADWVRTQLPNGTTNVQNNLRLSAGLVLRLQ